MMKINSETIVILVILSITILFSGVKVYQGIEESRKKDILITHIKEKHKKVVERHTGLIKKLNKENMLLRERLLTKTNITHRRSTIPAVLRGRTDYIATAYCATGNRTASGVYPRAGRTIAVDRRLIPLGVKVRLRCPSMPEYNGIYTAEDTGGDIKGQRIDIFTDTRGEAINFGRRTVLIEVIK